MIKLATVLMLLMAGLAQGLPGDVSADLTMHCGLVPVMMTFTSGATKHTGYMTRCENEEVLCYGTDGLSCKFKEKK